MRNTFAFCRRASTLPIYTTHSSPSNAHAAALATPCCPAPVSATMRRFPIRFASRAWPTALLILCAPVCARSSRLSRTRESPTARASRGASVSGVGNDKVAQPRRDRLYSASERLRATRPSRRHGGHEGLGQVLPAEIAVPPRSRLDDHACTVRLIDAIPWINGAGSAARMSAVPISTALTRAGRSCASFTVSIPDSATRI